MDLYDLQAMMIRAQQVQKLLRQGELGGEDALAYVVAPPSAVEQASLEMAKKEGVSAETMKLFAQQVKPKKIRKRVVTIEELACQ